MRSTPFKIKLFLNKSRIRSDGTIPIYARVRLNKQKMELTSHQAVESKHWNEQKELVIKHSSANTINSHLQAFKAKINEAYTHLYITRQDITLASVKAILMGKTVDSEHTLIELTEEHNKQFASLVGKKYSEGSYKNYRTTLKYLKEFIPSYYNKQDIPLLKVNYQFCEAYFTFLTSVKSCRINGANKHIQRIKKIINYAMKLGYISKNTVSAYKIEFEPAHKVALSIKEVEAISNLELSRVTLEQVRDVFLFQCYTGLSYSDIKVLSLTNIHQDETSYWIKMQRQKTKVSFSIPLLAPAQTIIEKYKDKNTPDTPLLKVLSNQKMNENLKVIQELAGIKKNLTTHLARHSFATIALTHGVPIESVSAMLGHTKLATTQIYAKVLDSKIAQDMMVMQNKFKK